MAGTNSPHGRDKIKSDRRPQYGPFKSVGKAGDAFTERGGGKKVERTQVDQRVPQGSARRTAPRFSGIDDVPKGFSGEALVGGVPHTFSGKPMKRKGK